VYAQFPAETKDYVPMVIAAAWLYLHPKEYGLSFPKVDAKPATFRLAKPASIYELTICIGNGGTRDGFMRALRNLNPRYEADQWIPAGTVMNGTVKMAGLYSRYCIDGERAELARQLVSSDPRTAIVRIGAIEPATGTATGEDGTAPVEGAAITEPQRAEPKKPARAPRQHRVVRGETLMSIARKYDCQLAELAKANELKAPRYAVRLGQQLKLQGCGG
jgi:membrane-bound lytic murein transglycosylase D